MRTAELLPIRGRDAIEILTNDHVVIKDLLAELVQADDQPARTRALELLKSALTLHNATEENLIYPALRTIAGEKRGSEHLYHETSEADVLVFELDSMLKQGDVYDFREKAQKLNDAVLRHIADEEKAAFPKLQDESNTTQIDMLTESVVAFRGALHFDQPDA